MYTNLSDQCVFTLCACMHECEGLRRFDLRQDSSALALAVMDHFWEMIEEEEEEDRMGVN